MNFHLSLRSEMLEQLFTSTPVCLRPEPPVRDVFRPMQEQGRGAVLVCQEGTLVGIFTERDALVLMAAAADLDVPLSERMTRAPVALSQRDVVGTAIAKMAHGGYRRFAIIVADGSPIGLLKVNSILHFLVDHFPATVYNLPPPPHHSTETREGA